MKLDWQKIGRGIWRVIRNRYVAATLIFLLLIVFVDQNNLFVISRLRREVQALRADEEATRQAMAADSIHAVNLISNMDTIERYAREEYLMKRPDEDVFVFSR